MTVKAQRGEPWNKKRGECNEQWQEHCLPRVFTSPVCGLWVGKQTGKCATEDKLSNETKVAAIRASVAERCTSKIVHLLLHGHLMCARSSWWFFFMWIYVKDLKTPHLSYWLFCSSLLYSSVEIFENSSTGFLKVISNYLADYYSVRIQNFNVCTALNKKRKAFILEAMRLRSLACDVIFYRFNVSQPLCLKLSIYARNMPRLRQPHSSVLRAWKRDSQESTWWA